MEKQWKERREQRIAEELVKYRKVLRKIPASGNRILNNRESAEVIYAEIMHALEFSCIEGCDYISAMIFTITFAEENNVAHPDTNAVTIANTLGFRSPETKREVLEMLERFYINGYYVLGSQEKHNALRVLIENNS